MQLLGLTSPNSVEQASRLEIQLRDDVVVLRSEYIGQDSRQKTRTGFLYCSLVKIWFFGKRQCLY